MRDRLAGSGVPVQIGYPRRFDPAFVAARDAVRVRRARAGHTVRSTTLDPAPPPAAYLAGSGGIFRDCSVHDFDAVRWVTGQEAVEVYAVGAVDPDAARRVLRRQRRLVDGVGADHPRRRLDRRGLEHPHQRPRLRRAPRGARRDGCRRRRSRRGPAAAPDPAGHHLARRPAAHLLHGPAGRGVPARARHVLRGGRRRGRLACTIEDAMGTAWIAEAATLSAREGRPVRIDEVAR